jgi:hypothetical protein
MVMVRIKESVGIRSRHLGRFGEGICGINRISRTSGDVGRVRIDGGGTIEIRLEDGSGRPHPSDEGAVNLEHLYIANRKLAKQTINTGKPNYNKRLTGASWVPVAARA